MEEYRGIQGNTGEKIAKTPRFWGVFLYGAERGILHTTIYSRYIALHTTTYSGMFRLVTFQKYFA